MTAPTHSRARPLNHFMIVAERSFLFLKPLYTNRENILLHIFKSCFQLEVKLGVKGFDQGHPSVEVLQKKVYTLSHQICKSCN